MLGIPLKYNVRNLFVRRVTTTLTVLGIGLVVAVFLSVMALGEGISKVFTTSGSDKNVLVLRQNSQSELQSGIGLDQVPLVLTLPGIEKDADGKPLVVYHGTDGREINVDHVAYGKDSSITPDEGIVAHLSKTPDE